MKSANRIERLSGKSGQGMVEVVIMLPLLLMLAAAAISVVYVCWQGLKTQQAANLAARIQGQERVGGGRQPDDIMRMNLGSGQLDLDPSDPDMAKDPDALKNRFSRDGMVDSVYGKMRDRVRKMFGAEERKRIFVPPPQLGANTDRVKVVRVMNPPEFLGFKFRPVVLEATAYGGEDPHAHALPRWGCTESNCNPNNLFWQKDIAQNGQ